jgi:hypothetical protein
LFIHWSTSLTFPDNYTLPPRIQGSNAVQAGSREKACLISIMSDEQDIFTAFEKIVELESDRRSALTDVLL